MNTLSRRKFLAMAGISGAATLSGFSAMASINENLRRLTILHTNDTHSRLDPFPPNDPNFPGMGGYARRAALINQHRQLDPQLLLLDAGDIFQGTPYFNMFGGVPELKLMTKMRYDASAMGNHELDNGIDGFLKVLPNAGFPFLAANYDFSETVLKNKIGSHIILNRNGVKVGIYGLGINPRGLVAPSLFAGLKYLDPVKIARDIENKLRNRNRCQVIICLSHLGFNYNDEQVSDVVLARQTSFTDIIIGGHTHTLLDPAVIEKNALGKNITIGQTGGNGIRLGKMEVLFNVSDDEKLVDCNTIKIYKNQGA